MLGDAQGLSQRMRDLAEARAGRVAFIASAGAASALMPRALARFRATCPDIEIDMGDEARAGGSVMTARMCGRGSASLGYPTNRSV